MQLMWVYTRYDLLCVPMQPLLQLLCAASVQQIGLELLQQQERPILGVCLVCLKPISLYKSRVCPTAAALCDG